METTLVEGPRPVVKKFNEHSPRLFRNANKALKTIRTMLNRPAHDLGAPVAMRRRLVRLQTPWFASKSIGTIGLRPQLCRRSRRQGAVNTGPQEQTSSTSRSRHPLLGRHAGNANTHSSDTAAESHHGSISRAVSEDFNGVGGVRLRVRNSRESALGKRRSVRFYGRHDLAPVGAARSSG